MRYKNPGSTASMILERDNKICLIRRKHRPYQGRLALPGGFLNCRKETLERAAQRELREETNYIARQRDLELFKVNSSPYRDPRGHVIDHVYIVKRFYGNGKAKDDADELYWVDKGKAVNMRLAFDHGKVLKDYVKMRRSS